LASFKEVLVEKMSIPAQTGPEEMFVGAMIELNFFPIIFSE